MIPIKLLEPCNEETQVSYMATYLLVDIQLSENLGGIQQVGVVNNSSSRLVRKTYSMLRQ